MTSRQTDPIILFHWFILGRHCHDGRHILDWQEPHGVLKNSTNTLNSFHDRRFAGTLNVNPSFALPCHCTANTKRLALPRVRCTLVHELQHHFLLLPCRTGDHPHGRIRHGGEQALLGNGRVGFGTSHFRLLSYNSAVHHGPVHAPLLHAMAIFDVTRQIGDAAVGRSAGGLESFLSEPHPTSLGTTSILLSDHLLCLLVHLFPTNVFLRVMLLHDVVRIVVRPVRLLVVVIFGCFGLFVKEGTCLGAFAGPLGR
mmetsp:Transcript_2686/g.7413  ORF Transcript_2686/g.7413 Transcript_2686/m.7413 type:complete len:255 (+) Transcript_2686:2335-3099(+)